MTRPAPITPADLRKYPHLAKAVQEAIPPEERASAPVIQIPVPRLAVPSIPEDGVYGFIIGVVFMGIMGILGRV
jgi:hypothetical protein